MLETPRGAVQMNNYFTERDYYDLRQHYRDQIYIALNHNKERELHFLIDKLAIIRRIPLDELCELDL